MGKARLKKLRTDFRNDVFERDGHKCVVCGKAAVDAHHNTDRNEMPNGGYCLENGISLCFLDHHKAESFHNNGGTFWHKGFHPSDMYALIGSSYEAALSAAQALGD